MQEHRSQQPTCEGSLSSSTAATISDCFTKVAGEVVMEDAITEEEEAEDETGEVFFLIDKALTNLSPNDPRSCMEGGSSLKNKLLYRKTDKVRSERQK